MKFSDITYDLIRLALKEDIGRGDITSNLLIDKESVSEAYIAAKEEIIVSGLFVAEEVFREISSDIRFTQIKKDGEMAAYGEHIAKVYGKTKDLLLGERTALNFIQRMSGIATLTGRYADRIKGYKAKILDTRKTAPGHRELEKYAVFCGGGTNHRLGLYDAILVKDNHIKASRGIKNVIDKINKGGGKGIKIEIEVTNIEELKEAIACKADVIMLDNMKIPEIQKAVDITSGRVPLEVSGGINLDNVLEAAKTGVDFISIGGLTHSARSVDISMNIL